MKAVFRTSALIAAALALAACGNSGGKAPPPTNGGATLPPGWNLGIEPAAPQPWALEWAMGAVHAPEPHPEGWVLRLPTQGSVHYVTTPAGGPLTGKTRMVMTFRIEADPGAEIRPRAFPRSPAMITLYFQRRGDSWTARHEAHRWYAPFAQVTPLAPGNYAMEARFDGPWSAVLTSTRANNPLAFAQALAEADRMGFALGGGDGLGHGVTATGPARIVITSFRAE